MPEYRRANTQGGTYFFTVNTYRRQSVLTEEGMRQALRAGIQKTRERFPFQIQAWVLLPDHLHCIWTLPEGDADFAKRWGIIKRHVSRTCGNPLTRPESLSESRLKRKETNLWQRRYWEHLIRDEVDYLKHVDYIHWNPVKHGLVSRVSDWPYSTFHKYATNGVYPLDWGGASDEDWHEAEFGE